MEQGFKILKDHLIKHKETILTKWFHLLLEAYPAETARHLKKTNSHFANPVGHNIFQGIEGIYEELLQEADMDKFQLSLDKILKIKAVQDVAPARAVAFLYVLKKVVRQELDNEIKNGQISTQELFEFESNIDSLALLAFNIYTQCREKIYQLRIDEIKKKYEILEKANMLNQSVDTSTFMQCSNYKEKINGENK